MTFFLSLAMVLLYSLLAAAGDACTLTAVPADRAIQLSITQLALNHTETWNINGALVVDKTLSATFTAAKKFERLEQVIPLINIFKLSEDRKNLQAGIKLFPGVSFQQTFAIDVQDRLNLIELHFTEGSFAGLNSRICFLALNENQTAVTVFTTGNLAENPVPFFITNGMLERISKSILRRWRNQIESEK